MIGLLDLLERSPQTLCKFSHLFTTIKISQRLDTYRSDSSTTDSEELKRIKSLICDLQTNVEESLDADREELHSMGGVIYELRSRFDEMENSFNRCFKNIEEVSSIIYPSLPNVCIDKKRIDSEEGKRGRRKCASIKTSQQSTHTQYAHIFMLIQSVT